MLSIRFRRHLFPLPPMMKIEHMMCQTTPQKIPHGPRQIYDVLPRQDVPLRRDESSKPSICRHHPHRPPNREFKFGQGGKKHRSIGLY